MKLSFRDGSKTAHAFGDFWDWHPWAAHKKTLHIFWHLKINAGPGIDILGSSSEAAGGEPNIFFSVLPVVQSSLQSFFFSPRLEHSKFGRHFITWYHLYHLDMYHGDQHFPPDGGFSWWIHVDLSEPGPRSKGRRWKIVGISSIPNGGDWTLDVVGNVCWKGYWLTLDNSKRIRRIRIHNFSSYIFELLPTWVKMQEYSPWQVSNRFGHICSAIHCFFDPRVLTHVWCWADIIPRQ